MDPANHIWHPYTRFSFLRDEPMPVVVSAEGSWLTLADGARVFDGISSWWCVNLGHRRPELVAALARQAGQLDHSILGHLAHPPALELASHLAHLMPSPDRHVMFGSDGSAAVEASLKIAVQYFHNIGQPGRTGFVTLREPYHGDTLGAVSVGYMEGFHRAFKPLLFPTYPASVPGVSDGGESMEDVLRLRGNSIAAVIVEPLLQGTAGMRMHSPEALRRITDLCREAGALLICDEIATGFYRTGSRFAFEQAGIDPDIVLMGKGLTGGVFPLSAAVVRDAVYRSFTDIGDADRTFWHGHTYTGHPVGCAVALAALDVYDRVDAPALARRAAEIFREELAPLAQRPDVRDVRVLGMVAAVELRDLDPNRMARLRRTCLHAGLYLRPLGPVVYLFPPLTTSEQDLRWACSVLRETVSSGAF